MEYEAELELKDYKPAKEAREAGSAEGKLAYILRFTGTHMAEKSASMFSSRESYNGIIAGHYNAEGALIGKDVGKVLMDVEGRACKAVLTHGTRRPTLFEDCTLDKVSLKPQDGRIVKIDFRLRVYPDDKQLVQLAHMFKQRIGLQVAGDLVLPEDEQKPKQNKLDLPVTEHQQGHGVVTEDGGTGALSGEFQPGMDTLSEQEAAEQNSAEAEGSPFTDSGKPVEREPGEKLPTWAKKPGAETVQ